EDFGLTHDDVAARVGRSRATISNTLRLLQLPPSIQRALHERKLGMGHARALLATPDRAFQEQLARRVVDEDLSVRAVEEAVRAAQAGSPEPNRDGPADGAGGDHEPAHSDDIVKLDGLADDGRHPRLAQHGVRPAAHAAPAAERP